MRRRGLRCAKSLRPVRSNAGPPGWHALRHVSQSNASSSSTLRRRRLCADPVLGLSVDDLARFYEADPSELEKTYEKVIELNVAQEAAEEAQFVGCPGR